VFPPKSPKTDSPSSPKKRTAEELSDLAAAVERGELSAKEYLNAVFDEAPITRERFAGKRILRLDRVSPKTIAAPLPETIDMSGLLTAAGLRADERQYLWANVVDGVSRRKMDAHLGWDPAKVARVQVRLGRRLRAFRASAVSGAADFVIRGGNSRILSFEENIGGRRCWSLAELAPDFEEVMALERLPLLQKSRKRKTEFRAA
jgi:hypothetical protein